MKVMRTAIKENPEKTVKLADVQPGEVFRFPDVTYEEALTGANEATFYMKIPSLPGKPDRCTAVSLDGRNILERDSDRDVFAHRSSICVFSNQ